MKKILVSLISEQPVPNILIACHYRPDVFWFISTKAMEDEKRTESIKNTLRLKGFSLSRETMAETVVNQDSFTDCMSRIESLIDTVSGEVEYIVNITGGNKVMALAAYEVFRDSGKTVAINYLPLYKNEFIQIFPRKKSQPLSMNPIKERLNLEEYLESYGFHIENKNSFPAVRERTIARKDHSQWILNNYEQLKGMLGFIYKIVKDDRDKGKKHYQFSATFEREPATVEKGFLERFGFALRDRLISKDMTKDEIIYLTGGWFEEYVFNEMAGLLEDGVLDDAMMGVKIRSLGGSPNDLDLAFTKDNVFYLIECKTLGTEIGNKIVNEELYKKKAISSLLGKGEKRGFICTTFKAIDEHLTQRAEEYRLQIFNIEQARNIKNIISEKFRKAHD